MTILSSFAVDKKLCPDDDRKVCQRHSIFPKVCFWDDISPQNAWISFAFWENPSPIFVFGKITNVFGKLLGIILSHKKEKRKVQEWETKTTKDDARNEV